MNLKQLSNYLNALPIARQIQIQGVSNRFLNRCDIRTDTKLNISRHLEIIIRRTATRMDANGWD